MPDSWDQHFNRGGYVPKFDTWRAPEPPKAEQPRPKSELNWFDLFVWRALLLGTAVFLWAFIFGMVTWAVLRCVGLA